MRTEPRAWVLNLDAEHELEAGRRYAPTQHLAALVARERRRLLGNLVGPDDVVVEEGDRGTAAGLVGCAWSPTPRALAQLRAAGATLEPTPAADVVRRVNARPFAARVRAPVAGASFAKEVATTLDEVLSLLARPAASGWLVRRTFGAAGRGRRRLAAGPPSGDERSWLAASLRRGPLVVEPWVSVTCEYTRSGWVGRDGAVVVAAPCFQETTRHGAWVATTNAGRDVARADDRRLGEAAEAAGRALAGAGYFGPFGIDAFRYRAGSREILNPLSEINARFTMDWTEGFPQRPELAALS